MLTVCQLLRREGIFPHRRGKLTEIDGKQGRKGKEMKKIAFDMNIECLYGIRASLDFVRTIIII